MVAPRVLLLDNYDSFTYNIAHALAAVGADVEVVRADALSVEEAMARGDAGIVVGPGPGRPEDAGISVELIRAAAREGRPLFGVCLGHQALGQAFGAAVAHAPALFHGKTSAIRHRGGRLFAGVPQAFPATRYHSLAVEEASLGEALRAVAWSDDGVLQGIEHVELPLYGVQFHPESVLTEAGSRIFANFLAVLQHPRERSEAP
ncbi:MAG TPA: aminodeoxychorismate/anthranilate synthase component II [Candidatus Dormibacteraeota bacterium]|nr:aminodeoxychorismate/anthranilate synthase component II [Candidatus Dormibacteraeota bacterium]